MVYIRSQEQIVAAIALCDPMAQTIGIDIGGANTKVASASGTARSFYFPLWRKKDLAGLLRRVKDDFKPERVGIVITGELADAFSSKKEGICSIVAAVNAATIEQIPSFLLEKASASSPVITIPTRSGLKSSFTRLNKPARSFFLHSGK